MLTQSKEPALAHALSNKDLSPTEALKQLRSGNCGPGRQGFNLHDLIFTPAYADLGKSNANYEQVGKELLGLGELSSGLGFMKLGQEERLRETQAAASREAYGLINNGSSGYESPSYGASTGTPRANIDRNTVHVAENEDDVQRLERATGMNKDADLDKVVRTVYGEASNQGPEGQAAVAHVIANRARESGMTPTDVVLAKNQFEPWSNPEARARMERLDPNSQEYRSLADLSRLALTREAADPTGGATHFYAPKAQAALGRAAPSWDDGTGVDIKDHRFFKHGYGPQGPVQVAQADIPAAGSREAQGFAVPGSEKSVRIKNMERALMIPNLPDSTRSNIESQLKREYALFDEKNKTTDEQREYGLAQSQGYGGTFIDFKKELKRAGATTINNVPAAPGDDAFTKKFGEKQADRWNGYIEQADTAKTRLTDITQLREAGRRLGSQGAAVNAKLAFGPYLEAMGESVEGLSDAQLANSIVQRLAPQMRQPGSGSTSDIEFKGFLAAIGPLSNNPVAREAILDTFEASSRNEMARGEIATDLATGAISRADAEKRLRAMPDPMEAFRSFRKDNPDLFSQAVAAGRRQQQADKDAPKRPARQTPQAPVQINDSAVQDLRSMPDTPQTRAQFDEIFGPGSAARILGGTR
jgi:spore germination cell wall hydrolase CwlJ-like protein